MLTGKEFVAKLERVMRNSLPSPVIMFAVSLLPIQVRAHGRALPWTHGK